MNTLRRIAILFFGVIFTVSLFMLVRILVQGRQEQAAFDRLSAALDDRLSAALEQPESADGQNPEQSHYEALKAQNPDFFGWISIVNHAERMTLFSIFSHNSTSFAINI